jgi:hypothetical protein
VFCRHVGVHESWKKMESIRDASLADHINRLEVGLRKKEAPAFAPNLLHHLSMIRGNAPS